MEKTIDTSSGKIDYDKNLALTTAWQTLKLSTGGLKRFNVKSRKNVGLWVKGNINTSDVIQIRIACYTSSKQAETPYYTQVQTIAPAEVELKEETLTISSADLTNGEVNVVIPLGISELVPYMEIEMKVSTEGATPAEIAESYITFEGVN